MPSQLVSLQPDPGLPTTTIRPRFGSGLVASNESFHDLDPDELRELAPRIPMELVEELMFIGNATEIAERLAATPPTDLNTRSWPA